MIPSNLVGLTSLMSLTSGRPEIVIGLIDVLVAFDHPDLGRRYIRKVTEQGSMCEQADSAVCIHGAFIAGILTAKRGAAAPAICPDCTLLIRSISNKYLPIRRRHRAYQVS